MLQEDVSQMESKQPAEVSDAELAQAWAAGDERAFEQIVVRHTPRVFNRCRLALGVADADDATQAVFLVLARRREQAASSPLLVAWLMTVANQVVRNAWRNRQRRRNAEASPLLASSALVPQDEEPLTAHLAACLAELSAAEREAVTLHHLAGCTLAEVGAQTGAGISTVHARVQRGVERLRQLLTRRGVALSASAIVACLASAAQAAVPPEATEHLRELATAGGGTGSTAVPSARALSWSRRRSSVMSRIAIAAGLLLIGGAVTHHLISAENQPLPAPAGAQPEESKPQFPDVWATLRIADGGRILAGIRGQPEGTLIVGAAASAELADLRGAAVARRIDFESKVPLPPGAPALRASDFCGAVRCAAADSPLMRRLRDGFTGPTPWLGVQPEGDGFGYWATSGRGRMTCHAGRLDFALPAAVEAPVAVRAALALAPDDGAVADFAGYAGDFRYLHGRFTFAADGLQLHVENASRDDAIASGQQVAAVPTGAAALPEPALDRRLFDAVPVGAICAFAVATRPGSVAAQQLALTSMMIFTPNREGGKVTWPVVQQALERWIQRIDGTLVGWIEPGAPLPLLTLRIAMTEAEATGGLRACGLTLAADGTAAVPCGPLMLSVGWRDGALCATTNPAGIAAIDQHGGFTTHPEAVRSLAALPAYPITACAILRSAALVDTLSPYLAMIDLGITPKAMHDYRASLAAAQAFSVISGAGIDGRAVVDARGSLLLAAALYMTAHGEQIAQMFHMAN